MYLPPHLADSNVVLRSGQLHAPEYPAIAATIAALFDDGIHICITAQVVVEVWGVMTRPREYNGFGYTTEEAAAEVGRILGFFDLLDENAAIFPAWQSIVQRHKVSGRQVHDARLVAVMQVHNIHHLLTFNGQDFMRYGVTVVVPSASAKSERQREQETNHDNP